MTVRRDSDIEKAPAPLDGRQEDKPTTTLNEDVAAYGLEKVLARHGRIDLVPMPSDDPNDPYNWPSWRKHVLLVQVAFHSMMGAFSAAAVIPSFETFAEHWGISITQASYFVSVPIIFLGVFPLLWAPVSNRIGRRPVLLLSALLSAACHFAGAYCHSYGALMTTRVFQAIFLCPPQSIGATMVGEMFFLHERGAKIGIWTLLNSLGPPVAPLLMGPLVYHTNWQWTFYLMALINLGQFVLYMFLGPETAGFKRPVRGGPGAPAPLAEPVPHKTPYWRLLFTFHRVSAEPWSRLPLEVVRPFTMALSLPVLLPTLAYAVVFSYTNVLLTVEIPALLGRKYELNAQQTGIQFVAAVVGAILGEIIAGRGSDTWMTWRTKRAHGNREPEMRLPFSLPGFVLALVGILVFGIQLQNTKAGVWNVTPLIGVAIALFASQLVTTVVYAYVTESQPPSLQSRVPPFVAFVRQLLAFVAPFYLGIMYEDLGSVSASGILAALSGPFSFLLVAVTMVFGRRWRQRGRQA
ncbi:uncharacterized protein RHOBADRAFT_53698 [Rhodotorula graminis WP1]|uniref:Major facilitator superfamily (MFS) profile domain-containing protein n=1 Tax=Rhodotorula graminis (strain WP1) TaxID=578459 RepID=A0A194S2L5_RHOGW|nr:uncharacterized protein RHOBADRAFT_53698 [Rhodotorula graminis WP1]KPV74750.1 hypothetical protein RHOBADRAFT_53698 [Rhodotorula graminis WP1]